MRRSVARSAGLLLAVLVLVSVMGPASAAAGTGPFFDHEPGHIDGNESDGPAVSGDVSNGSATNDSAADNESDVGLGSGAGNDTPVGGPGSEDRAGSGANATSGGGGGGGMLSGMMPSTPSLDPKQWLLDMVTGAYEDIREGAIEFIDEFNFVFTGVPAPGSPTDILSWISPPEPEWEVARNLYLMVAALMTPFLTANFMQAFGMDNRERREQMIRENIGTVVMYPAGWFLVAALCHLTNEWTQVITPAGEEFFAAPEGIAQLGVGVLIGAGLAKANIIILLIGILLVMLIWFLILFTASTWLMWWTMRSSGFPILRTWGNYFITTFCIVLLVRGTQALGLRFLFHLPLGEVGPGSALVLLVVTAIGLWFLLYKLLRVAIEKTAAASAFTLGLSYLPQRFSAHDAIQSGKQAANQSTSSAKNTASTIRNAPQKIRNAPSAARQRVASKVPDRFRDTSSDASGSSSTATYDGPPKIQMRSQGSTPSPSSRPVTDRLVRADGGSQSTAASSKAAGSGKRRMRLKRTDSGYEVVDK